MTTLSSLINVTVTELQTSTPITDLEQRIMVVQAYRDLGFALIDLYSAVILRGCKVSGMCAQLPTR
jgi:hypothetical protein